jgi:MFS family permease
MLGLPLGLGLSFLVSGYLAQRWGWRSALFVAGLPGFVFGLLALFMVEPARGAAEKGGVGAARRPGNAVALVLRIPTMWWIILSGAVHNFNMYAIGHFLSPYLQRYHGQTVREAGAVNGLVYCVGGLGILAGGWACDRAARGRVSGRMEVATLATLLTVPFLYLALRQPPGAVDGFRLWMLPACLLLYVYYSAVYATIQDVVEPALRGTAMALYFFAMYLLGAALGPFATGWISDHFARRAAAADGAQEPGAWHQAVGLHDAMGVVPLLALVLVVVLFAASRTVRRDHERLAEWMRGAGAGRK